MSTATHVLVADDDATTWAVFGRALAYAGHQVTSAAGSAEARALLGRAAFDKIMPVRFGAQRRKDRDTQSNTATKE